MPTCNISNRDDAGRLSVGILQGETGTDYPLISPSDNIRYLLSDLFLSLTGVTDSYTPPFRIKWLYGCGCGAPEYLNDAPTPIHDHDICVVDANDVVVFDSTVAGTTHTVNDWGDRLKVVMWQQAAVGVASMAYHTAWNYELIPTPFEYASEIVPVGGTIDERCVQVLPKQVNSIGVLLDSFTSNHIELASGYNMRIETEELLAEDTGLRKVTQFTFHSEPGDGIGVFPDCEPEPLFIRDINGITPTEQGDFFLKATDCYWVRQPVDRIGNIAVPHIQQLPGSVPAAGLPDADAGTTKTAAGWPTGDAPEYAHLQIGNDCIACCDCADYVAAAQYMNTTRNLYSDIGNDFQDIRNLYHENRTRWLDSAECVSRYPLRLKILPQFCPFIDVAVQFCNQTEECLTNLELTITLSTTPDDGVEATEIPGFTFIQGASLELGRQTSPTTKYQMGGDWPVYTASFNAVHPSQSASVRFRLEFNNCGIKDDVPYAVTACAVATINGIPVTVTNLDDEEVVAEDCETRTLNCPQQEGTQVDYLACDC